MILIAEHLKKTYWDSNQELNILTDVNLSLEEGEFACISGQSGCGKSTLLHLLGLLDTPDSGNVIINGQIQTPDSADVNLIRNKMIGFVFQFHYLMEDLTAWENVALPLMIGGVSKKQSLEKAKDMLANLNMASRLSHFPHQLSGGEQQRVALARALINQPKVVLADEPTGNLDPEHSKEVLELIFKLNQEFKCAFILVTHDLSIADRSPNHYKLADGILHRLK